MTEIQGIFIVTDVDSEEFLYFYEKIEMEQTHDLSISIIKDQSEKDEKTDNDENY